MQCESSHELLPCCVMTWPGQQHVLEGVDIERCSLSACRERAGGVRHLLYGVPTELRVAAVGSDTGANSHHRVGLMTEVQ